MDRDQYKIKVISQLNSIIVVFVLFPAAFYISYIILPATVRHSFALVIGILETCIFFILFHKIAAAVIELSIDAKSVRIKWLRQFAFHQKEDILINWSEIKSISTRSSGPYYDTLNIRMLSGKSYAFYHFNILSQDDYSKLKEAIQFNQSLQQNEKIKDYESEP